MRARAGQVHRHVERDGAQLDHQRTVRQRLEAWLDDTGNDGFNLAFAASDESKRDVVELIVPELQRRGRYRHQYTGGTLREPLLGTGPRLAADHPGRKVRIAAALPAAA